ncbi:hypothetical protein [Rhodococcus ruber]|uniref:hypothetical protein n=1 Tax=Rhodococcus ruber TaxID=1830 RepID=UPI000C7B2F4A|nr:hypothetical protein [Rhodococcus ruber]AUM20095.1 hypothetical protein CSW53_26260 [Rhodococcus ruber]
MLDGIDQAATVEVEQWWARGRAAYDPDDPLTLPQPDTDPQVAAALEAVRGRKARDEIRAQWFAGVEQGRREATAAQRQALIAEVAVDPRLIAKVEGRRPDYLPAVARDDAQSLIAEAARAGSPLRQAAAKVLLEHHPLPAELYERAYAEWDRLHGRELTWDQDTAGEWTAWMTLQLRRDPLVGSWAGLPMWTRTDLIEFGIETAFAVMAEERPDLIKATAGIPTERLAAELRGNIIRTCRNPRHRMSPPGSSRPANSGSSACGTTWNRGCSTTRFTGGHTPSTAAARPPPPATIRGWRSVRCSTPTGTGRLDRGPHPALIPRSADFAVPSVSGGPQLLLCCSSKARQILLPIRAREDGDRIPAHLC